MSVSIDPKRGVRFKTIRKHGLGFATFLIVVESVFSLFLYISLAQRVFVVTPAEASPGVPEDIAYQGLLTDTSGNPLGGAGTVYCFRYSIWDATTSGNQLWPAGTPSNSTTTVIDGVFSDQLGRTDSLSGLDFVSTSTYYLQVQVSTSSLTCASGLETLTPRQQIVSDAWSQTSQGVYGSQLRTFSSSNVVQIGTTGGVTAGNQTLLSLDVVNTGEAIGNSCSINGTLWYDSNLKRALVCENLIMVPISNSSTTIAGIGTNGTAAITAGSIVFSNSNGVSFGQNGSTITASVNAGGGETMSRLVTPNFVTIAGAAQNNSSMSLVPFRVPQDLVLSNIRVGASINVATNSNASSANKQFSLSAVMYSLNGSTLSSIFSGSNSNSTWYSSNATASITGVRGLSFSFPTTTLTAGDYWMALILSTNNTGTGGATTALGASYSMIVGISQATAALGMDPWGSPVAASRNLSYGLGIFSTGATMGSIAISDTRFTQSANSATAADLMLDLRNFTLY